MLSWKHNFKILIDSVEDYARQWAKREKEDLDTLSEWVKSVRSLMQIGLYMNGGTNTGAIRRLKFEIVNIEITQHMFVIKSF
jgi:hypothetical protein